MAGTRFGAGWLRIFTGVSDEVIQQILRHENVTTTINIYVEMVTQDAEDAMLPPRNLGRPSEEVVGSIGHAVMGIGNEQPWHIHGRIRHSSRGAAARI